MEGDPTNKDRAEWALVALNAHARVKQEMFHDCDDANYIDLLVDVCHAAHAAGIDPHHVLDLAIKHFEFENAEEN